MGMLVALTGCGLFQKDDPSLSAGAYESDYSDSSSSQGATYEATYSDPYASSYGAPPPSQPATYEAQVTPAPRSTAADGQFHTVARNETLYSLARSYYGDERRWKDIYRANQDSITDPNRIFVGQRLLIP
jgi:nucleoid-associated protein YgaU